MAFSINQTVSFAATFNPPTTARMSNDGLNLHVAGTAILLAVSVNSLVKSIFSMTIGGWILGRWVGGILLVAVLAGLSVS